MGNTRPPRRLALKGENMVNLNRKTVPQSQQTQQAAETVPAPASCQVGSTPSCMPCCEPAKNCEEVVDQARSDSVSGAAGVFNSPTVDIAVVKSRVAGGPRSVGSAVMDAEHAHSYQLLRKLLEEPSPVRARAVLDDLQEHFEHEEKFLTETGFFKGDDRFDKGKSHRAEHEKIIGLFKQLSGGQIPVDIANSATACVALLDHIDVYDARYEAHARTQCSN